MFGKLFVVFLLTNSLIQLSVNQNAQPSISESVNRFGLQLLQKLSDGKSNVFQSPMSVAAAVTMAMLGANGKTYEEIYQTLRYTKDKETIKEEWESVMKTVIQGNGTNVLAVANKMLLNKDSTVLDEYKNQLKSFDAEIEKIEGDITGSVNEWVKKKTRGMIPQLIDGTLEDVYLVLLNAIYFQGYWQEPMEKSDTNEEGNFYNYGKDKKEQPMMHQEPKAKFNKIKDLGGFKMLELPYKESDNQKYKMLFLLPDSYTGLQSLVEGLTIDKLNENRKAMSSKRVIIDLPRFKIDTKYQLEHHLPKMGIVEAFRKADFSGMTGLYNLHISLIIHKAVIEVDEAGTKAAAATAVVMEEESLVRVRYKIPPETFKADHPFLYFIIDDITGMILFCGTVINL